MINEHENSNGYIVIENNDDDLIDELPTVSPDVSSASSSSEDEDGILPDRLPGGYDDITPLTSSDVVVEEEDGGYIVLDRHIEFWFETYNEMLDHYSEVELEWCVEDNRYIVLHDDYDYINPDVVPTGGTIMVIGREYNAMCNELDEWFNLHGTYDNFERRRSRRRRRDVKH